MMTGRGRYDPDALAKLKAQRSITSLLKDFGVKVRWLESASDNTRENAQLTAKLLLPEGHKRVAVVTHAWHMPRSVNAFEQAGFAVVPAPTTYSSARGFSVFDFVPSSAALQGTARALHEWIGILWYRIRN